MGVALSKLLGIEYYDKDLIKIASEETEFTNPSSGRPTKNQEAPFS